MVFFEIDENKDSLYIECTKCGAKYYLNEDFKLDDEAWEMYCKNWDCMMDTLASEKHWFAEYAKSKKIVIRENTYKSSRSPFVTDYEDWVCDLDEFDGSYELKCDKCNAVNVLPFGKWGCCVCGLELYEICNVEKWDEIINQVTLACEKCSNKYTISLEDAKDELFECFECYKKQFEEEYICPVCCEKYPKIPNYYDGCESCGFDINRNIKNQTQYTSWLRNTVRPCAGVWNEINPKYRKALNDLKLSLDNERKLSEEKAKLISQLSKCHRAISSFTQRISDLEDEIEHKNTKIKEMKSKVALLLMFEDDSKQESEYIKSGLKTMRECTEKNVVNKGYSMTLEELDLSVRSFLCLKRAGIDTVEQLAEMSYSEIRTIRNLGEKSFEEVVKKLAMLGIYLKE